MPFADPVFPIRPAPADAEPSTHRLADVGPSTDSRSTLRDRPAGGLPADLAEAMAPVLTELVRLVRAGLARDDVQLLTTRQLAELLAVSVASVERLLAAGKLPRPLKLGGSHRYQLVEVRAWIEAGCPPRREWETRRK